MRTELKARRGQRALFRGTFDRFGQKSGWVGSEQTVLLRDISDSSGQILCDHLWFNLTKGFEQLGLQEGEMIEFRARVLPYRKRGDEGYGSKSTDYKLSHPAAIRRLTLEEVDAINTGREAHRRDLEALKDSKPLTDEQRARRAQKRHIKTLLKELNRLRGKKKRLQCLNSQVPAAGGSRQNRDLKIRQAASRIEGIQQELSDPNTYSLQTPEFFKSVNWHDYNIKPGCPLWDAYPP